MNELLSGFQLLLLLSVANTAPIAKKRWMGRRWGFPLDAGLHLCDGRLRSTWAYRARQCVTR
ncbi:hypothetical protein QTI66_29880 [Variovorax sp. J22R133]|uniref:hypothetical protein n=1 Tax=Variovorax brevis TaxID=3053503 RepID=UPI0025791BE0|nr:hypothetical protein [Variovorax sp. J22R133]MDM0116366.1 hypothetical protein [Variovorax sp. J22R133]